ncbi:MAG: phosphoribosylanthranilate isomerase [Microscillaceae bacterium]|jgi:phosphoribosylanthranilate isomerase|nr:phosphoribosylanthranilate isomerase [Microscillaceae bacterium]
MNLKLKVCGMRDSANIAAVADLLPDFMGFIFYPQSPRFVGDNFTMPALNSNSKKVGVFVNQDIAYVIKQVSDYQLDMIQLHGNESIEYCLDLKKYLQEIYPNRQLIKAFGIDEGFDFEILGEYAMVCDYFLFDTKTPQFGGAGVQFDWQILRKYTLQIPVFMSGGLSLDNLSELLAFLQTTNLPIFALDVNSKFEIAPAQKDVKKVAQLRQMLHLMNNA